MGVRQREGRKEGDCSGSRSVCLSYNVSLCSLSDVSAMGVNETSERIRSEWGFQALTLGSFICWSLLSAKQ